MNHVSNNFLEKLNEKTYNLLRRTVLITFYNRCTFDDPCWEVYAHFSVTENHHLDTFKTREEALLFSHGAKELGFDIPVMEGYNKDERWKIIEALEDLKKEELGIIPKEGM